MFRSMLLVLALLCSHSSTIRGDDYLLRIDTMGYVDASDEVPKEILLHSIETIVRPQSPFRCKVVACGETLVLAGKLSPADHGDFNVQIRFAHSVDTGIQVLMTDGVHHAVADETASETTVTMAVGDSISIAGFETTTGKPFGPQQKSRTRSILSITKYQPTAE